MPDSSHTAETALVGIIRHPCCAAGARSNAAVHLCRPNIDFAEGAVPIVAKPDADLTLAWHPKDLEARTIPVPDRTVALLARMQSEAVEGAAYVFLPPERVAWIKARQAAGTWKENADALNNLDRISSGSLTRRA